MKIKSIASSSAGNCHAIEENGEILLIDVGIPVKLIRKAIGSFENVVGCVVSHEHGDHAGYVEQLRKETSFPVYTIFKDQTGFKEGCFQILPVQLSHDVDCFGFYILTKTDSLFYATDTSQIDYTFPGLKKAIVEANFSWDLIAASNIEDFRIKRTIENHLDFESALKFAERHPDLDELWLAHLSDGHSDAARFKKEAEERLGIPVFICPK